MSNTDLTTQAKFYKIIAIIIAVSLLVSSVAYYFYFSPQAFQNNNEQPNNVYHVQGILSVYKNGKLVHQGADLLTNSFYNYLPFILGDVCTASSAVTSCPSGNWANGYFTSPPPALSCSLYYPFTSSAPSGVPIVGAFNPAIYIAVGTGSSTSPTDCVLNTLKLNQSANIRVWSPYTGNMSGAPTPCPNPTQGCVQMSTTYTAGSTMTLSEAMLYVAYSYNSGVSKTVYTLIAHDTFPGITLNPGDTLNVIYTFIFPGIQTNSGAYNENQAWIAPIFAQCLSRQYFGFQDTAHRLCIDNAMPFATSPMVIWLPNNPCNDTQRPTSLVYTSAGTLSISPNAASKYVKIMATAGAAGSGIQMLQYNLVLPGNYGWPVLEASASCSVATLRGFAKGDTVIIQLNFP